MDIDQALEKTNDEYSTGKKYKTNYLNFKEDGSYIIRIITGFAPLGTHWVSGKGIICFGMNKGCKICPEVSRNTAEIYARNDVDDDEKKKLVNQLPGVSVQMVCGVIDRKDKIVKIAKLPYSVAKKISEWKKDPEYPFGKDGSPLFDIKITKKTEGRVTYSADLVISSVGKALTEKEIRDVDESNIDPERFVIALKKKAAKETGLNVDNIDWEENKKEIKEESQDNQEELPTIQANEEPPMEDEININNIPF